MPAERRTYKKTSPAGASTNAAVVATDRLVTAPWLPSAAVVTVVASFAPLNAPAVALVVSVAVIYEPGLIGPIEAGTVEALKSEFGVEGLSVAERLNVVAVQVALSLFVTKIW